MFSVDPSTGKVKQVAGGLVSAKDLAVAANGDIYVAELFRGRIAKIKPATGKVRRFIELPLPATVEIGPRRRLRHGQRPDRPRAGHEAEGQARPDHALTYVAANGTPA